MKKIYVASMFFALGFGANAQTVLLSEDFQGDFSNILVGFPSGATTDPNFYNFDEDGLADGSGASRPGEWFAVYPWAIADSVTSGGDTNVCLGSNSWTNVFSTPVMNWLISPNVTIPSGATSAVLRWKSAPRQTPLYLDGYAVMISNTDNTTGSFGASMFDASQYSDEGGVYPSYGGNWAAYTYIPSGGWIHGWDGSSIQPAELEDAGDSSRWIGILTEQTLNLGSYIGQNIFFAIVHNSNDDNLLAVDDIIVEVVTGIENTNAITKINTYPNPATNFVTIEYVSENASPAILKVTDIYGRLVSSESLGMINTGVNKFQLDVSGFARGTYNIDIKTDMGLGKVSFIKN